MAMRSANYKLSFDRQPQQAPQGKISDGMDGIGFVDFWGITPAVDLLGEFRDCLPRPNDVNDVKEATNIKASESESVKPELKISSNSVVNILGNNLSKGDKNSHSIYKKPKTIEEMMAEIDLGTTAETSSELGKGEVESDDTHTNSDKYYNILISGAADLRHVIKTVTKYHKTRERLAGKKLRFFLHDKQAETTTRHILFLQIINNRVLTPRERAEIFLSLYGNVLVRDRDMKYVSDRVNYFLNIVSETECGENLEKLIDLSWLTYKDRDALEEVIKSWKDNVDFNVEELWDTRLRGYYRGRYEYRKNIIDSDWQNWIKTGNGIIHWQHFRDWRHVGVAFESRLGSYSLPNRTLASYIDGQSKKDGGSVLVRGYWGDIINGPYWAFGTKTEDPSDRERLFKKISEQYRHTATDVSEFNLEAWIREMDNYRMFNLPAEKKEENEFPYNKSAMDDLRCGTTIEEIPEGDEKKEDDESIIPDTSLLSALQDVKIIPLIGQNLPALLKKSKFKKMFDRAYFANMLTLPLLKDAGIVKDKSDNSSSDVDKENQNLCNAVSAGKHGDGSDTDKDPKLSTNTVTDSSILNSFKENCVVTVESMKSQVCFDAKVKVAYRTRMRETFHKLGFEMCPTYGTKELIGIGDVSELKEYDARELELKMGDYLTFKRKSN